MPRTSQASRLIEVSAVLEVLEPPQVPSLYFWAMQVDFEEDGLPWGGGHTGLQWNRRFPGGTAVNWGGYASQDRGGGVLTGSQPDLFSFPGDPNTMAFPWRPRCPYRLRVLRAPADPGGWRADITDLSVESVTVIRDLSPPAGLRRRPERDRGPGDDGGYLLRPMVWSEVFADCDAPSVAVRWSDLSATSDDGEVVRPQSVTVNYQAHQGGGCANTSVRRDGSGLVQVTNTSREVQQGARLDVGLPAPLS